MVRSSRFKGGAGLWRAAGASRPRPLSYEGVWRFTAPAVDVSVPQARHAVRDLLDRQGVPVQDDLVQGLLLIVSELVTNAVRHAALLSPELAVEVAIGAEWVRVSVEDNHPYRPKALEADYGQTGGRGLLLVREITLEAGGVCDVEHTAAAARSSGRRCPCGPTRIRHRCSRTPVPRRSRVGRRPGGKPPGGGSPARGRTRQLPDRRTRRVQHRHEPRRERGLGMPLRQFLRRSRTPSSPTSSGSGRSGACTRPTKRWLYSCSTSPDSGSGWL